MSPKKPTYHHGDLRRTLIRAAEELIARQGTEAVTMRVLSRHIGVSHTAAYRHFQDKEDLLCALAENGFEELERRLQALAPELQENPLDLIRAQGQAYLDFALENPARYRIMFGPVLVHNRDHQPLVQAVQKAFAHLLRAIEQGLRRGVVRAGNPLELASVSWSMVHGLSQLAIDGQLLSTQLAVVAESKEQDLAQLTTLAMDALVDGLATKQEE